MQHKFTLLCLALLLPAPLSASSAVVHARVAVTILPQPVRLIDGRLYLGNQGAVRSATPVMPQPRLRPCPFVREASAPPPNCHMVEYSLL